MQTRLAFVASTRSASTQCSNFTDKQHFVDDNGELLSVCLVSSLAELQPKPCYKEKTRILEIQNRSSETRFSRTYQSRFKDTEAPRSKADARIDTHRMLGNDEARILEYKPAA